MLPFAASATGHVDKMIMAITMVAAMNRAHQVVALLLNSAMRRSIEVKYVDMVVCLLLAVVLLLCFRCGIEFEMCSVIWVCLYRN